MIDHHLFLGSEIFFEVYEELALHFFQVSAAEVAVSKTGIVIDRVACLSGLECVLDAEGAGVSWFPVCRLRRAIEPATVGNFHEWFIWIERAKCLF